MPRPQAKGGALWRAVTLMALLGVGFVVVFFGVKLARYDSFALQCPYELDYGEAILLNTSLAIARGHVVYNDYRHEPYIVATYPPVYPLLCALGARLWGVSFAFGRALSIGSTLGIAALLWLLLRRAGTGRFAAGLGTLLFLFAPSVCLRSVYMRIDMLAILLGVGAVYCTMRGGRWLVGTVALSVLAFYTRQSEVAPLAAAVLYLACLRQWRPAALVAGSWAAAVAAVFLALQVGSHGGFYRHVVMANQNQFEWYLFHMIWQATYAAWRWPFLAGAAGLALALLPPRQTGGGQSVRRPYLLLALYFGCAMLVTLTTGKVGSSFNYTLEAVAAAAALAGVAYQRLSELLAAPRWRPLWAVVWLLVIVPPAWTLCQPGREPIGTLGIHPSGFVAADKAFLPLLRRADGDVLSEDIGMLLLSGHRVLLDPHKMSSLARDGRWDQRPLIRDIRRRRFAYIVTTWDPSTAALDQWGCYGWYRWTKGMGDAIKAGYHTVRQAGYFYLLAPAKANEGAKGNSRGGEAAPTVGRRSLPVRPGASPAGAGRS